MPFLATDRARRDDMLQRDELGRPLVLTCQHGASVRVAESCPRAREFGIRPGLTLGQAQAMVPDLLVLPHEPRRDRALLTRLANWALRFSPVVEPMEPHTLLVDVTGCARLFAGEPNLAQQALRGLAHQGFTARVAIADTVGAACALATHAAEPLCIAPPGDGRPLLLPLPPAALRLDGDTVARLEELGVRTIGELLRLPRASLPARFGPLLVHRLQQALGEVHEELAAHCPPETPAARMTCDPPLHDLPALQAVARRLLDNVFHQVLQQDHALRRLDSTLYFERVPPAAISLALARGSRSPNHVATLLAQRLERVDLSAGVTDLVLTARETVRWHPGQSDLFEPPPPDNDEALTCLLDHLAQRVGHRAVLRPRLADDHQPEAAFRYVPAIDDARDGESLVAAARAAPGGQPSDAACLNLADNAVRQPRPVRLLTRPILIRVISLSPDGPPTWFHYLGREHRVARAWGPERLETAWWRGPDVRRDYFRVATDAGEQYWLFRDLRNRTWYLHGVFA